MATAQHIVNKVSVQLKGVSTQAAFQLQQDLAQYLQHSLPAKLEGWLDANFPPGAWVEIDTLQVNIESVGVFSQKKLEALLEEALQKQLQKQAQAHRASTASPAASPFRAWLFFMEWGHLPWWYKAANHSLLEEQVIAEWQTEPVRSAALLQEAIRNEAVRQRLLLQSSTRLFDALLQVLRITGYEMQQWEEAMTQAVDDGLENAFRWQADPQHRRMIWLAIRYAFLQRVVARRHRALHLDEPAVQRLIMALEKCGLQAESLLRKLDELLTAMEPAPVEKARQPAGKKEKEEPHLMVGNAGLVLFHPYLEYFFRSMDLLDEAGSAIRYPGKAVQLLQLLATGQLVCHESDTTLGKVLCGLDKAAPVYTLYPVSAEEREECSSLLEAVIRNWPALKNTSPEGLQETFIQRQGKLSWKNDHWLLQVEQKTVDVLLNGLPWPLSVIRLPWMQCWMQVEWG